MQHPRRLEPLQRRLGRTAAHEERRLGKQAFDRPRLVAGRGQRREVHGRQIGSGRHAAALEVRRDLLARGRFGMGRSRLTEQRIREDDGVAAACAWHLHAEQIAAAGDVARRVAFDEIAPLLVHEGLERHQAQLAVRREQQTRGVAERTAQRAHDQFVERSRPRLDVGALWIAQRAAQRSHGRVDRSRRPEVDAARRYLCPQRIGRVPRRAVGLGVPLRARIERAEQGELDERRVQGNRPLHGVERHGVQTRP